MSHRVEIDLKWGESLQIGDEIKVTAIYAGHGKAKVGIDAPLKYAIWREELIESVRRHRKERKRDA